LKLGALGPSRSAPPPEASRAPRGVVYGLAQRTPNSLFMQPSVSQVLTQEQCAAIEVLAGGSRFLLSGHVKPDGDCLGSQAALARVLERLGKEVWIVNPDPVEDRYEYLAREVRFRTWTGGDLPAHDVEVFLDFCELSRTGALEKPLAEIGRASCRERVS
jgi:hypothetical protein